MRRQARGVLLYLSVMLFALVPLSLHAGDDLSFRFLDESAEGEYSVLCPVMIGADDRYQPSFML